MTGIVQNSLRSSTGGPAPATSVDDLLGSRAANLQPGAPGPKRILYIEANEDGTVGGSHRALFDLVRNLDRQRFEPIVLFYQQNMFVAELNALGVDVQLFDEVSAQERAIRRSGNFIGKRIDDMASIIRRFRFLRRHRVDLIHINNSPRMVEWLPAARLLGIPSVVNVMGDASGPTGNWIRRRMFRSFQHYLPISRYIADAMVRAGIRPERMDLVYLGVDVENIHTRVERPAYDVRNELGVDTDRVLALMVGNIRQWKGQHIVLQALSQMSSPIRQKLHVAFAGATTASDEPYLAELKDFVRREGLEDNVSFLGGRGDVPDLLNAADFALHASIKPEPFGLVVVEAMALGKPVIAANTGGPAEVVTSESGCTFDPNYPPQLADLLVKLVSEPDTRARLSAGAAKRAEQFTVRRYVEGVLGVYGRFGSLHRGNE